MQILNNKNNFTAGYLSKTCFCILQLFYPFMCFCILDIPQCQKGTAAHSPRGWKMRGAQQLVTFQLLGRGLCNFYLSENGVRNFFQFSVSPVTRLSRGTCNVFGMVKKNAGMVTSHLKHFVQPHL